jgi:hypothetical protein
MHGQVLDEIITYFLKKALFLMILGLIPLVTSIFEIVFTGYTTIDQENCAVWTSTFTILSRIALAGFFSVYE